MLDELKLAVYAARVTIHEARSRELVAKDFGDVALAEGGLDCSVLRAWLFVEGGYSWATLSTADKQLKVIGFEEL